jgi:UDP-3-O-[3-hydroxymyristoyl] glucosamine N-acyltransferase
MKLSELCKLLQGELVGNGDIEITNLAKIEDAKKGDLTFLANPKYSKYLDSTNASAILVRRSEDDVDNIPHIVVKDPYISFQKALNIIYPIKNQRFDGIHPTAVISDKAKIAANVRIAPFVYIGPNVSIGENTTIYPGCILLDDSKVGKDCLLYSNVTVYNDCEIQDNVILHSGVVIGSDGFGFAPSGKKYDKIPQVGKVIIESDVEIGANCTIDRATIGETKIKKGCKLDNLVQVAHNVVIGENTVIAAQTGISGSTKVGKHVTIAGQVGIVGHIEIGDEAILAAQSGISKSVPKGEIMFGYPASPLKRQKKIEVVIRQLPEIRLKIREMENTIKDLTDKLNELEKGE